MRRFSSVALKTSRRHFCSAPSGLSLSFILPHEILFEKEPVYMVNVPSTGGEFGILAKHVPIVAELKPGAIKIYRKEGGPSESYFVSGGFVVVHSDSSCDISVAEAFKLEDFDAEKVKKGLAEYSQRVDSATAGEESKDRSVAENKIALSVYKALAYSMNIA